MNTPSSERIFFTFFRTFSILFMWVIVLAENIKSNLFDFLESNFTNLSSKYLTYTLNPFFFKLNPTS